MLLVGAGGFGPPASRPVAPKKDCRRVVSSKHARARLFFGLFISSARHSSPVRLLATCCRWHYSGFLPPFRAPSPMLLCTSFSVRFARGSFSQTRAVRGRCSRSLSSRSRAYLSRAFPESGSALTYLSPQRCSIGAGCSLVDQFRPFVPLSVPL